MDDRKYQDDSPAHAGTDFTGMAHRRPKFVPQHADLKQAMDARRQLALMEKAIGRRVANVLTVVDRGGDHVFFWVFSKGPQPVEGERVVVLLQMVEQKRQASRLEEVVIDKGGYFLPDGTNLAEAVRDGAYAI